MIRKRVNRSLGGTIMLFLILGIVAFIMFFPMVLTISNAFKPLSELFQYPPKFLVRNPTFDNFSTLFVLMSTSWVPFSRYILNTFIITGFGVIGHVLIASMAAYPLSKHDFKGRKTLNTIVIFSLLFTSAVTGIPMYIVVTALGINNTYLAVILPAFQSTLGLYLMRQFMVLVPDSLIESGRLDGASEFKILWSIIMPNVKPAWLTLTILMFQGLWGNDGGGYLRSEQLKPLSYAINQITAGGIVRAGAAAAASLLMLLVPVVFFVISQSQIIETMATSGIKE